MQPTVAMSIILFKGKTPIQCHETDLQQVKKHRQIQRHPNPKSRVHFSIRKKKTTLIYKNQAAKHQTHIKI